jgi:hypothetical protein
MRTSPLTHEAGKIAIDEIKKVKQVGYLKKF